MILRPSRNLVLPGFIGSAVLLIALTLLTIVARSPYTHSNLGAGFDPGYTRTAQMTVNVPMLMHGDVLAVAPAADPVARGKQLFVTSGCASCHGLDGRGGIIGPSILGTRAQKLRTVTNFGPQGMPPYAPGALSDQDLAAIAAFLASSGK